MTRQTLRDNRWPMKKVDTPTPKIEKITAASTAEKMIQYASRQLNEYLTPAAATATKSNPPANHK